MNQKEKERLRLDLRSLNRKQIDEREVIISEFEYDNNIPFQPIKITPQFKNNFQNQLKCIFKNSDTNLNSANILCFSNSKIIFKESLQKETEAFKSCFSNQLAIEDLSEVMLSERNKRIDLLIKKCSTPLTVSEKCEDTTTKRKGFSQNKDEQEKEVKQFQSPRKQFTNEKAINWNLSPIGFQIDSTMKEEEEEASVINLLQTPENPTKNRQIYFQNSNSPQNLKIIQSERALSQRKTQRNNPVQNSQLQAHIIDQLPTQRRLYSLNNYIRYTNNNNRNNNSNHNDNNKNNTNINNKNNNNNKNNENNRYSYSNGIYSINVSIQNINVFHEVCNIIQDTLFLPIQQKIDH